MKLDRDRRKRLCEALEEAFPSREALARMVSFGLAEELDVLVPDKGVRTDVFTLVRWAEAQGDVKVKALVTAARDQNPGNEALTAVAGEILGGAGPAAKGAKGHVPKISTSRLPHTGSELFGRDEEMAWLEERWEQGAHAVSIVAWGGVGKSCLVNAWLRRRIEEGWTGIDKVYGWSFYSQGTTDKVTSADEFISAALTWFGDVDGKAGSAWDKGERLAGLVRKGRTLLVLDGIEPLQWASGPEEGQIKDPALQTLVRELGAQNRGLCLISSRVPVVDLADYGDKTPALDLEHISVEAGAKLLEARGVNGTEELQQAAKEVDGHCLALALLGNYLRRAHKGDVRKRKEIGPLEDEKKQGHHARRIMAAYERRFQGKPELSILRILGLFDRPASQGEIGALRAPSAIVGLTEDLIGLDGPAWNEALATLRDAGLLAEDEGGKEERLDAHPLIREHFGEQLRKRSPGAWREGHRRLYEHLRSAAKELPETVEEMGPLYAAVVHGCLAGRNQEALDEVYYRRIQRGAEAFHTWNLGARGAELAVLSAFFDSPWEKLAPGLREADQAYVLAGAGFGLRALGRLHEAATLMRMGLQNYVARSKWKFAASQAGNISELLLARGDLGEALTYAEQSVEFADKGGDAGQRTRRRTVLADTLYQMGRQADAAARFEEAERMQKERLPAYPLLFFLPGFLYCDLLLDQGREADVMMRGRKFFEWRGLSDSLLTIALDHLSLGRAQLLAAERGASSDLAEATAHVKQAVDGLRRAGRQDHLPRALLARAALSLHTRDLPAARRDLTETLTLATRCGFRLHEADAHLSFARLHLASSDLASAADSLARARALITATGYHRRDAALAEIQAMLPPDPRAA